ncbi:MAG TPA: LysR family transcriptional regulator [Solirubrobacteraceae bacterium]|jgi:DNA-binding transcriptional LysR family regulator
MLNVHRLAVLNAVVTHGSLTGAATELNYTVSGVSQHIAALERETGVQLFERLGRRIRPTLAGETLARYSAEILDRVSEAEAALAAVAEGRTGRIRLATFASASTGLVPPAAAHFRTAHPEVEFQLSLAEQADALFALRSNRVDLAIVLLDLVVDGIAGGKPPLDDGLQWRLLWDDPYTVVVPRDHPLASRSKITLAQVAQERMISGDQSRGCPCSEALKQLSAAAGLRLRYAVEVNDFPTVQSLVATGMGIAIVPQLGLAPAVHEGVVVRPLVEPRLARQIYAVVPAGRSHDPLIASMLDGLQRAVDEVVEPSRDPLARTRQNSSLAA